MSISATITARVVANLLGTSDLSALEDRVQQDFTVTLANGTGANKAETMVHDQRTLAGSTGEDLDLSSGLTDKFGNAPGFTKIKALVLQSLPANGGDLLFGGAAANAIASLFSATADELVVKPGGMVILTAPDADGYAVVAGTGDLLRVENAHASPATYNIIVIGETS